MASIIKATGTILSASSGTQYVPFSSTLFNTSADEYVVNSTSAVSAANAAHHRVNAKITIDPVKYESNTYKLEVYRNGAAAAAYGFGELDQITFVYQQGENRFNRNNATMDKIGLVTLQGSTLVSAAAGDQIGIYLTGPVSTTTVTADVSVEKILITN